MFPSEILQPPPTNSQKFSRGVSFEAGVLRRYYRRRVIMDFTSKGPAEAKSTNTLRRIHLIRRQYAKRRGRRETMLDCFFFDCPLSKTVKILDQRSRRTEAKSKIRNPDHVVVPVNKKKMESLPPEAIAYPVQDAVPVSGNNIGSHCRRCGKEFIPLPNLRGSAREYRCNKCLGLEALTADFAYSCAVQ